ncbi:hypothetical protein EHQ92_12355 [Leptospira biflexa]|uniref:FcpA-related putative periplasmic flagellar protein n=1 Tax=Leptospira biflexa TaxID=172 RepID=UPI001082C291|nr:hypothetical protein [Leptospira biflexa]TGM36800.1 hypothetical protein EHQ89_08765 [Leptospira biflexa]TGM39784.1 hypothetical protein EHQ80_00870 [Leptospira biflexa]TGM48624.1 hypothetical protein EHQ92_12355 [Leptospira biflexa]TGM48910.1 hypothetical protein EHQ88_00720 [Leptospira biflexa]TGM54182.1 hypothetical protein EHQ91_04075 [Leptospira biflexa]
MVNPHRFFWIMFVLCFPIFVFATDSVKTGEPRVESILPSKPESGSPWGDTSLSVDTIPVLDLVDEKNSQKRWQDASKEYSLALEGFESGKKGIEKRREDFKKDIFYEDRYEWQKVSRRENKEKEFQKQLYDLRSQTTLRLVKAMNVLDKIENPKVKESASYLDLKSGIYREYIKHQEFFKNYLQVIDFTHRYIEISSKNEMEAEPHRLLALSYEKMEQTAQRSKNQELYYEFKELKKKHLLRFAELHYGRESKEYAAIEEKVAKDF